MLSQEFINKQKQRLEKEKAKLEKDLRSFARKNKKVKNDWITEYPNFDNKQDEGRWDEEVDEVEEYDKLLSVSYALEIELKAVNQALEKIKKGTYGICENCGKQISLERLKAYPQAIFCLECQKKQ